MWVRISGFAGKLHHETYQPLKFVPTFLTFTKRNFLYNAPLKTFSLTENQFSGKIYFYTIASRTSTCLPTRKWSITSLEECEALPCPKAPPEAPEGGWSWYEYDRNRYDLTCYVASWSQL